MTKTEVQARIEWIEALLEVRVRIADGESAEDSELLVAAMNRAAAALSMAASNGECTSRLRDQFALTDTECDVLWHLVAHAVNPRVRSLMVGATGELLPTVDALRQCVYGETTVDSVRELGSESRLVADGLVLENSSRIWSVRPRVLAWLLGDRSLAPQLHHVASVDDRGDNVLVDTDVLDRLTLAARSPDGIVTVVGRSGIGRRTVVHAAATAAGVALLDVDASRLSSDESQFLEEVKLLVLECGLLGRSPLIANIDRLGHEERPRRLRVLQDKFLPAINGPIFVTSSSSKRVVVRGSRPSVVVEVEMPSTEQRARFWLDQLGQGTQEDGEYLATQYPLAPALIHHAAKAAKARANGRPMQPEDIYAGVRAVLDDKLGDYATRVEVTQTWEDLVLPEDDREAIQYLVARIRQRRTVYEQWGFAAKVGKGLGTSALFSGPPGTGKTMVAALIAKELGLELYQVDLAKIVSKYIGETERNLAAMFDAAEAGHAVLLFDEADSLFGKRTDVKSSNDRYANLETNYLLQRLESFTGICLLTSNHESNIDPAFQRRLSLHLRFQLPAEDERATLWSAMLPPAAPVAGNVDMRDLARRFAMSGGYIRNAVLRAAFLAADEHSAITSAHLERSARIEYEGMGKIVCN